MRVKGKRYKDKGVVSAEVGVVGPSPHSPVADSSP